MYCSASFNWLRGGLFSFLANLAPSDGDLGGGGLVPVRSFLEFLVTRESLSVTLLSRFESFGTGGGVPGGGVSGGGVSGGGVSGGGVPGGGGELGSWERGMVDFSCI